MIIEVPMPSGAMWLNSNNRIHRMQVAKLTKLWREAGKNAAAGLPPVEGTVRIVATIHKNRDGRWDPNNVWPTIKALIDGTVDAGLLVDDDWTHVIGPDMRRGAKGEPRVVLEFVEPEARDQAA